MIFGQRLDGLPFSGYMVADYISAGFGNGKAFPIFAAAQAPTGSILHEAIYTTTAGQNVPLEEEELLSAAGIVRCRTRIRITGRESSSTRRTGFRFLGRGRRSGTNGTISEGAV